MDPPLLCFISVVHQQRWPQYLVATPLNPPPPDTHTTSVLVFQSCLNNAGHEYTVARPLTSLPPSLLSCGLIRRASTPLATTTSVAEPRSSSTSRLPPRWFHSRLRDDAPPRMELLATGDDAPPRSLPTTLLRCRHRPLARPLSFPLSNQRSACSCGGSSPQASHASTTSSTRLRPPPATRPPSRSRPAGCVANATATLPTG